MADSRFTTRCARTLARAGILPVVFGMAVQFAACDILSPSEDDPSVIEITPAPISMEPGDTLVLQAVVRNRRGRVLDDVKVRWSSSNTEIIIASPDGTIRSRHTIGFTRVRAEAAGITGEALVAVGSIRYDNVRALAIETFRTVLRIDVPEPAIGMDSVSVNTNLPQTPSRFVAVVHGRSRLHWLELWPDGRISSFAWGTLTPTAGVVRVGVVVMDNGFTDLPQLIHTKWQAAIDSVNAEHQNWARGVGLQSPLISFQTTTLVATPGEVNPDDRRSVFDFLSRNNVSYDVPVVINPVPNRGDSVYSRDGDEHIVTIRCICGRWIEGTVLQLSDSVVHGLARTLFHHEIGHAMGWQHGWGGGPRGTRLVTDPALLGWADVDGDGIVEALDPTPYGMLRRP